MFCELNPNRASAPGKSGNWLILVWLSVAVTWLPAGFVHADWMFDANSYSFILEPQLVAGDAFYQHWANEASNPSTYLHSGNMLFDTRSWYGGDVHVLRSWGHVNDAETFADYRLKSIQGPVYAVRSTTWHNAYQPNLTLDHYNAYSSNDGLGYTDYYLHENWDFGDPPGTGWGQGCIHTAKAVMVSPGKITRLRYGVRELTDWEEWYAASWRIWAGSTQTEYHDNYLIDPFAEAEGGPVWSSDNFRWIDYISGSLANSNGDNPAYCTYLIAHHGAMTGIDIRLTSTDLSGAAEAIWTPNADVHLHLAIATDEDGPYTDVYVGEQFVPNSANPGAYVNLVPYGRPEVLFVKIYSIKDAGNSYYIRWGGFHIQITAEDPPPDHKPKTCQELWELTPPDYNFPGDFDNDCDVNIVDLALFVDSWLSCNDPQGDPCCCDKTPFGLSADLNHDCSVDIIDFSSFADSWQQPCDSQVPTTTDRPFREMLGISGIGFRMSNVDFVIDLGATWVRDGLTWAEVEMSPGVYCIPIYDRTRIDKIHEAGLNIILHLGGYGNDIYENPWDPNAYAAYAAFCVQRLRGKIQACHCINEPHNFGFSAYYGGAWNGAPPSPWVARYAELVRLTAAAVREVAPEIPVMADEDVVVNHYRFLDEGLGPYVSACSWHPYGGCDHFGWDHPCEHALPYQVADEDGSRASLINRLRQKGESVTGRNFEIYGTEIGWFPDSIHPHLWVPDMQTAANYLIRSYIISYANNMKILCWYTLQDPLSEFGLIDSNYNKNLTYYAYRNMAQTIGGLHLLRYVCGQDTPTYGVQAYLFGAAGEQNVLVLWSANDLDYSVTIYGIEPGAQILDSLGNIVGSSPAGPLYMTIDAEPHYIVGNIPEYVEIVVAY